MVQQNIVSYVLSQLRRGKKLEDINRFLIQSGYDKSEVESSIQYVINTQTNPLLAEQQRIQQLARYVQQQLDAGYEQQIIANFLISRGYPYYEVNSALQQATAPRKEVKVEHKLVIVAVAVMFLMTAAVTIMYFKAYTLIGIGVPEKLLDVEADRLTTIVQQGGELAFQVKLINFGYEKRFDVVLDYKIIDRDTQGVVLEKSETVALSTTLENIVRFDIPETMKPGNYVLRVDATYQEFTATSGFVFEVLPKEIAEERLEEIREELPEPVNVTEIPELAPEEVPLPEEAVPEEIPPPPEEKFYEGKTRAQAFQMVMAVSVREPSRAIGMCKEFRFSGNLEGCIIMLARFKEDARFCEEIEREKGKDSCYVQVIFETGQFELCGQIIDANTRQSCEMMGKASEATQLAEQGRTEDVQLILETFPLPSG